jgi:Do/DeqQ family serine protease
MDALTNKPVAIAGKGMNPVADAVAKVGPAVVNIHTLTEREVRGFPGGFFGLPMPMPKQVQRGAGSGVIISKDGYILTNNHVVAGANEIKIALSDGRTFKAKVVGRDDKTDLAVVKVNANNLPAAQLGDSKAIRPGDWAIAIGNPFDRGNSVSLGIVSATHRNEMVEEGKVLPDMIQTDAAINPGNSGGALVNIQGQVIGINTAIYSPQGAGNIGIGFAIPIHSAKTIAKQLIEKGKIVRPYLGVTVVTLEGELREYYKQNGFEAGKGAAISQVGPGTPAAKAGLMQYDVIIKINDQEVKSAEDVTKVIQKHKVGQVVRLTVWRAGQTVLVGAKLAEMPQ